MIVEFERSSRRVWLAGRRCHHGLSGAALAAAALALPDPWGPLLLALGLALALHDLPDFPWPPARRAAL